MRRAFPFLLAIAAAVSPLAQPVAAKGTLLLNGGGQFSAEVAARIATLLGQKATLCAITTANQEPSYSQELFGGLPGITVKPYNVTVANASTPDMVKALDACDGYYIEGGLPDRLSKAFLTGAGNDTPALAVIRRHYEDGALIAGSSAGAIIPGPVSLCECGPNSSIQALRTGGLITATGFGLVSIPVDAHSFTFSHYGREMVAMAKFGWSRLVAVDERTAVEIPPEGPWSVVGDGQVALILAPPGLTESKLTGFDVTIMARGDRFDPEAATIIPRKGRNPVDRAHSGTFVSYGAFDEHELNFIANTLVAGGAEAISWGRQVPSRTTLSWIQRSQAYDGPGQLITHLSLGLDRVKPAALPAEAVMAGFGAESRDWRVPPIAGPRPDLVMHVPTPLTAPGVEVVRTEELVKRLESSAPPLMIDTLGAPPGAKIYGLEGSVWLTGAGAPGSLGDSAEQLLGQRLAALTHGNKSKPIVFYCFSSSSWWSYDAAERAKHLGYKNVAWYRGGTHAWEAAGGELAVLNKDQW